MREVRALALIALVLYGAVAMRIPARGFVTVDTGAIYLQAVQLATAGNADIPVGPLLAPVAREYFPWRIADTTPGPVDYEEISSGWFVVRDGRATILYPIGFGWLAALVYRSFGESAMVWIAVVAGAVAVLATGGLAARLGVKRPALAAAIVAASPLAMYATLVWGHAPGIAAAALGFWALGGEGAGRALAAGLAFGAAGTFRNEGLLLAAVICACVGILGPARWRAVPIALGVALGLAPGFAYNRATFGSVLDRSQAARTRIYVAARRSGDPVSERLWIGARTLWESSVTSENLKGGAGVVWGGAIWIGLGLVAAHLWGAGAGAARGGLRLVGLAGLLYVWLALSIKPQLVPGLLLCAPAAGLGLVALACPRQWWGDARALGVGAALFLLGCALRGSPGWQWGARYMLLALPVLAALGARVAERVAESAGASAVAQARFLTVLGAAMMVIGWRDLASEQAFREEEQRWIRSVDARVVAFDHWWFSWENPRLALDGELFFVTDASWLAKFLEYAKSRDVRRVAFVTRATDLGAFERAAVGWRSTRYSAPLPYGHVWNGLLLERL